jgi:hypothetical protein
VNVSKYMFHTTELYQVVYIMIANDHANLMITWLAIASHVIMRLALDYIYNDTYIITYIMISIRLALDYIYNHYGTSALAS